MHYLHSLAWLIDGLAEGNPGVWAVFFGILIGVAIGLVHDLRANNKAR
jgi:hypothetical protein